MLILIVEDDEDQGAIMEWALAKAGYPVRRARNGVDALREVEQELPDAVLLDLQMPVMDGFEFASIFRGRFGSNVPIIVTTAAENVGHLADQIGAQGCMEKPIRMSHLLRLLEQHVGRAAKPSATSDER